MYVGKQHGKAEEAINFYISLFKDSSILNIERYGADQEEPEGTVMHAVFSLNGQEFMAMDSDSEHPFTFSRAIALFVDNETQEGVDILSEKLSEGGEREKGCWLKNT